MVWGVGERGRSGRHKVWGVSHCEGLDSERSSWPLGVRMGVGRQEEIWRGSFLMNLQSSYAPQSLKFSVLQRGAQYRCWKCSKKIRAREPAVKLEFYHLSCCLPGHPFDLVHLPTRSGGLVHSWGPNRGFEALAGAARDSITKRGLGQPVTGTPHKLALLFRFPMCKTRVLLHGSQGQGCGRVTAWQIWPPTSPHP